MSANMNYTPKIYSGALLRKFYTESIVGHLVNRDYFLDDLPYCVHCGHCGRIMENEVPPEPLQRWGNKPMHDGSGVLCRACYFGC